LGVLTLVLLGALAVGLFSLGVQGGEGLAVVGLFSLVSIGILYGAYRLFRVCSRPPGSSGVEVCPKEIRFRQHRRSVDVLRRSDIELIVVDEDRVAGVGSFTVYGPAESLLGVRETGWFAKPAPMVMRILSRHGCPGALSNTLHAGQLFTVAPVRKAGRAGEPWRR
jgi:hypothetical protein